MKIGLVNSQRITTISPVPTTTMTTKNTTTTTTTTNAKRQQATKAPEAKAERIASLNAMRETIQTKINAIRAQNNGEGWHKHKDEAKSSAWRILVDDLLFVDASIHNANLGFVDVASVRQRILRSL